MANDTGQTQTATDRLWDTKDVMRFMKRGRTYISNLCNTGKIPYIPGRPNRFIPEEVKNALTEMQVGGKFGKKRRKAA